MSGSVPFDRAAQVYDATRGFPPGVDAEVAAALAAATNLTPSSWVLEVGVGTGRIALPLSRFVGQYVGVDLSAPMLARLRAKQGNELLFVLQGDVTRLPLAPASVDLVLGILVLHLVRDWREMVAQMVRVVRPDGAILFNIYDDEQAHAVYAQWNQLLAEQGFAFEQRTVGTRDLDLVAEVLASHGFTQRTDGVAAVWPTTTSVSELVGYLANRVWSITWDIPEPIFDPALAALRAWVAQTYPDPDALTEGTGEFRYVVFRRPTG